jgi:transposase
MKKGRAGTMTHDDKRHGTTTLFAAMNVLDGAVIGHNMQRHRHQEFIRFLNAVERAVPAGKTIHAILDNYAAHKHPAVRQWLASHPRWIFHFTPTSASWLNAAEGFFATLTKRRLKRGVFRSVVDLQAAINRLLEDRNANSKPFQWVADPDKITAAVKRGHQALDSIHSHVRRFKLQARIFFCSRSSVSNRPPLGGARGTIMRTTVDHALIRGLVTAGPVMRRGASSV